MSTPESDDFAELREALLRDAARLPERAFDPALHHATLRRLRALTPGDRSEHFGRVWKFALAGCAVLLLTIGWLTRHQPPPLHPQIAAAIASTERTIANLVPEPVSALPAWISPTAALLDPPRFSPHPSL
jgi:hypothetical protein